MADALLPEFQRWLTEWRPADVIAVVAVVSSLFSAVFVALWTHRFQRQRERETRRSEARHLRASTVAASWSFISQAELNLTLRKASGATDRLERLEASWLDLSGKLGLIEGTEDWRITTDSDVVPDMVSSATTLFNSVAADVVSGGTASTSDALFDEARRNAAALSEKLIPTNWEADVYKEVSWKGPGVGALVSLALLFVAAMVLSSVYKRGDVPDIVRLPVVWFAFAAGFAVWIVLVQRTYKNWKYKESRAHFRRIPQRNGGG